ncbi:response regulator transcription factor [Paenibacillus gallinarum]|uniref:Response regulator n=1 Tax=Paenibacillus gallinarum TaxID=2762232 RepID=A0ABR8T196_9BACL|nr:response regulator [Paenibacillus gallinarum]MBD7969518.1 response regulator [Paenibacillus gallinarum]
MYRLLIVDDEEIITDGLYEVLQRFKPEMLDIYKAYSAKEALKWMSRSRIDIVLTDIRMPGMSGLDMSQEILTHWPRCKIVFLTGFSEFDYAYQAIQLPNARYLLKTEGYEKVTQTVLEVVQELDQDIQTRQLIEKSQEQIGTLQLMAQGDYIRQLLQESHVVMDRADFLAEDFKELGIALDPNAPVILALGRLFFAEGTGYLEKSRLLTSVRMIWDSFMFEKSSSIGTIDKHGDLLWLLQPSYEEQDSFHLVRFMEGTLELIQEACQSSLSLTLNFTLSGRACDWTQVTSQYDRLRQLQQLKIGNGISMILVDRTEASDDLVLKDVSYISHRIERLEAHLESGKATEFMDELNELTVTLLQTSGSVQKALEGYYAAALVLFSHINRMGLHSQMGNINKLMQLDGHASMKEGFLYLEKIAEMIFQFKNKDERDRATQVIEHICQYIEENLNEDLSLVRLAELHFFNPSYLSRFFKQEYGINLSEYIDKCRTRKAKELLRNHELKVRDVSISVGYEAAHSFTRFFKKMTGITPQEFRDSLYKESAVARNS